MGHTPTSPSNSPNRKKGKVAAGPVVTVDTATDLDVLLGRGKGAYLSKGNQRLLQIVSLYLPAYIAANKNKEKIEITNEIVTEVRQGGGRFLCEDSSGQLYEAPDQKARIKVAQAIRHKRRLFEDEGGDAAAANSPNNPSGSNAAGASLVNQGIIMAANSNMNTAGFPAMVDPFASSSSRLVGSHEEMSIMQNMIGQQQPPTSLPRVPLVAMFPSPPKHLPKANAPVASTNSKPAKKAKAHAKAPAAATKNKKHSSSRKTGGKAADMDDDREMLAGALLSLQAANSNTFPESAGPQTEHHPIKEEQEEAQKQKQPSGTETRMTKGDGNYGVRNDEGKNEHSNDNGTEDRVPRVSNVAFL